MKPQPCVCQGSALPLSHVASPLAAFLTPEFYLRMKRRDQRHTIGLLCADHYDALSFFISQRFYFYLNVGACRSQQRAPGLLALQGSVNCPMSILGTENSGSLKAQQVLLSMQPSLWPCGLFLLVLQLWLLTLYQVRHGRIYFMETSKPRINCQELHSEPMTPTASWMVSKTPTGLL